MRPVRLHVEGFGSFRDPVDIDFDGVDFFALVGPTGSGKSTVIDAICFALYGSVPRYDDEKLVGRAVSLGKSEAKVSLVFDVRGERYTATRVVRVRDGKVFGSPKVSLERAGADGSTDVVADKVKPMKEAVEQLLGLQFQHFTKCVVLPQGEFSRFLHDDPAKRQDLLVRLLDLAQYERVARRARAVASEADNAVAVAEQQLERLAGATPEGLAAAQERVVQLLALRGELEDAKPNDRKLEAETADAERRARDARHALDALAAVRVPDAVTSLDERLRVAREARLAADERFAAAEAALDRLQEQADDLGDVAALERLRDAHQTLAGIGARRVELRDQLAPQVEAVERCDAILVTLATQIDAAQQELESVQAANANAELRHQLEIGAPCPVCEQEVHTLPVLLPTGAVDTARAALAELRSKERQAHSAREQATAGKARLEHDLDALDRTEAELAEALDNQPSPEAVDGLLATARDVAEALRLARTDAKTCRGAVRQLAEQEQALEQQVQHASTTYTTQRDGVAALGAPAPEGNDLVETWRALEAWAHATVPQLRADAERAANDVARSIEERAAMLAALEARCRSALVAVGNATTIAAFELATVEAKSAADNEVDRIERALVEATEAKALRDRARHDGDVARTLVTLLRADRFERWLVTEALEVLVDSASVILYRLSGGQYSLACESAGGDFVVVDHANADERRAARTLSGGETFQASLALALALSEQVAMLSSDARARLDAIFLDEGFGTLDADALETVASTIEHLGTDGRMVGIVTHVPALAERVPVRFRVAKNDRTSHVVREDA